MTAPALSSQQVRREIEPALMDELIGNQALPFAESRLSRKFVSKLPIRCGGRPSACPETIPLSWGPACATLARTTTRRGTMLQNARCFASLV